MRGEFTAVIEEAPEGGYWAICPEVRGANGQGETVELVSLGGFGGYGIVIGPQWFVDSHEFSEAVADGICVRRYP